MNAPPPEPASPPAGGTAASPFAPSWWRSALREGIVALALSAASGQVVALLIWSLGGPGSLSTTPRVGWLVLCLFQRVPLDVEVRGLEFLTGRAGSAFPGMLGFALLTGSAVVGAICFRAGRRVGRGTSGGPWAHLLRGASIAVPYAALGGLISIGVELTFTLSASAPEAGSVVVRPSTLGGFAWPAIVALATGAAGGYLARSPGARGRAERRSITILAGAWRMLLAGLALALVGAGVLGALHPDATAAYAHRVSAGGAATGALVVANQLLALPNHAVFVLAPAMGSCVVVEARDGDADSLCWDRVPARLDGSLLSPASGPDPTLRQAPWTFGLLFLVPVGATVAGGLIVGRRSRADPGLVRAATGAASGAVFSLLCAAAAFMAGLRASGILFEGAATWIGPRPGTTAVVSAAWGVVGGAIGALLAPWWPAVTPARSGPAAA